MTLTLQNLDQSGTLDPKLVGGKAGNLFKVHSWGMDIPYSIVMESNFFDTHIFDNTEWKSLVSSLSAYSYRQILNMPETYFESLQERIGDCEALREKCSVLSWEMGGAEQLMVRSSANLEDSPKHSLAGLFQSYRVENTPEKIRHAVGAVLKSYYCKNSVLQLARAGLSMDQLSVSILLQPFIEAKFYGTCVSRAPGAEFTELPAVDSTFGLVEFIEKDFEGVTSGDSTVKRTKLGEKNTELPRRCQTVLVQNCRRIEKKMGRPVEIEWAWRKSGLTILQMRPIVNREIDVLRRSDRNVVWSRHLTRERFQKPISPLGWSIMKPSLAASLDGFSAFFGLKEIRRNRMALNYNGHIYANEYLLKLKGKVPVGFLAFVKSPLLQSLPTALIKTLWGKITRKINFKGFKNTLALEIVNLLSQRLVKEFSQSIKAIEPDYHSLKHKQSLDMTKKELVSNILRLVRLGKDVFSTDFSIFTTKSIGCEILRKGKIEHLHMSGNLTQTHRDGYRLKKILSDKNLLQSLLKMKNVSDISMMDERVTKQLSEKQLAQWQSFYTNYGHWRSSWDVREKSWGEDVESVLKLLMTLEPHNNLEKLLEDESEIQGVASSLRSLAETDDTQHFWAARILDLARLYVRKIEIILIEEGLLESDQIFFLTLPEILHILSGNFNYAGAVAERRREIWLFEQGNDVPELIDPYRISNESSSAPETFSLGSAVTSGPVMRADDLKEICHASPGSILVTTSLKPEFVPYLHLFKAVVSQTGGLLSHGVVAARSIGIPAVIGWRGKMSKLKNGKLITVDAKNGVVGLHGQRSD